MSQDNLSFRPATPRACPSPGSLNTVHHCLTYKEDDEPSLDPRMKDHSPADDILAHNFTTIEEEDEDDIEEHFLTVSLNDNFWMEEPVPERHLCIREHSRDLCPYPCPYSLNLLHLTQEDSSQYIDPSDIFKFSDVIVSASNDDVSSLEDFKEDTINILQNFFVHEDRTLKQPVMHSQITLICCLINDMFMNSDTTMWIYTQTALNFTSSALTTT